MINFLFNLWFQYRKISILALVAIIIIAGGIFAYFRFSGEKILEITSPNGKEQLRAGRTYQIAWKSRNVGKVAILLIKGGAQKESRVITEGILARQGKYDWQIFVWEEPRQDYKISIFEYPWQEGKPIDYSDENFTILGPQFASCDNLSIGAEWLFIPSDYPNLKKVFITESAFSGNLEGLEGADKKCQTEAGKKGFSVNFKAFLGDDKSTSKERLNLEGIFVEAESAGFLPEEKTCHRFLGKNFDEFFKKFSDPLVLNQEKLDKDFFNNLSNIWLGRIDNTSKKDCITILTKATSYNPSLNYSFTSTCQNWNSSEEKVAGYPPIISEPREFPACYTPKGVRIDSAGIGGLASGIIEKEGSQVFTPSFGKACDLGQKLLCVQQ